MSKTFEMNSEGKLGVHCIIATVNRCPEEDSEEERRDWLLFCWNLKSKPVLQLGWGGGANSCIEGWVWRVHPSEKSGKYPPRVSGEIHF